MPDLNHAQRHLERATYTPYKPHPATRVPIRRAWDKWSYVAGLSLVRKEFVAALNVLKRNPAYADSAEIAPLQALADLVPDVAEAARSSLSMEATPLLADVAPETLQALAATVVDQRKAIFEAGNAAHQALLTLATKAAAPAAPGTTAPLPSRLKLDPSVLLVNRPGTQVYRYAQRESLGRAAAAAANAAAGATGSTAGNTPPPGTLGEKIVLELQAVPPPAPALHLPAADLSAVSIGQLWQTAGADPKQLTASQHALDLANRLGIPGKEMTVDSFTRSATLAQTQLHDLNYAFGQRMKVEPIGMLHLERVQFTPSGIERGGLSYSVALSPAEEVNISHKEWSNTSEEFQNIVTDYLESYSEQGVAEKNELTQSTNSQSAHSSGFSLGVTASGGFGPVSISSTASFNMASSASNSAQEARQSSSELTKKASSRSKKEHKMSFKVASASGTEDEAIRRIKNPFTDRCTRVDYYQLMRRWRVDLLRYGVRLTYDLAIPEPGSDILSKIVQINALTATIQQGFNAPGTTVSWARFDLKPQDVRRDNYMSLAAQYNVMLDAPPLDQIKVVKSESKNWPGGEDGSKDDEALNFPIEVPDGYDVIGIWVTPHVWHWDVDDDEWHFNIDSDLNSWFGASGIINLAVSVKHVASLDIEVVLTFGLKSETFQAWQMKAWSQLHDAAMATYLQNRSQLKDQLAQLQAQLGAQDALSLRQIEREEVMKQVLRWLFGPSFTFVPAGLPANLYGSNQSVVNNAVWGKVLAQGEIIKFLHQAIEWENMLYFLYPYFWSHTSRWELKKYLDHPDFMHRSFLRAGSARVVLTIRPGFEKDFVSYLETGKFDALTAGHPYLTIAEEMQAYAKTNYPNLPSANPDQSARPLLSVLQRRAWDDIQAIMGMLEKYKTDHGHYPSTADGLGVLAPYGSVPPADPWGRPYVFSSPGQFADFEVVSYGANGVPGGEDDDADITSYADASLIGRWYEFTPTPALDIAFDEIMPSA